MAAINGHVTYLVGYLVLVLATCRIEEDELAVIPPLNHCPGRSTNHSDSGNGFERAPRHGGVLLSGPSTSSPFRPPGPP